MEANFLSIRIQNGRQGQRQERDSMSMMMSSSSSFSIAKLCLLLVSFSGVSAQAPSDFILSSPQGGFVVDQGNIVTCKVTDAEKVSKAPCYRNVSKIQLQTVRGAEETGSPEGSSDFPACDNNWNTDDGRCVKGSAGSGEYVYEFNFTPQADELDNDDVFLRCYAQCLTHPPYPFNRLAIRPIPSARPTDSLLTTEATTAPSPTTTSKPEKKMCGEAYAGIVVCVILGLFIAGVVAAIFKLPKIGPAAQPAELKDTLAPAASAPNTASASSAMPQPASSATAQPASSATATPTASVTDTSNQEDQSNAKEESEKDEVSQQNNTV